MTQVNKRGIHDVVYQRGISGGTVYAVTESGSRRIVTEILNYPDSDRPAWVGTVRLVGNTRFYGSYSGESITRFEGVLI